MKIKITVPTIAAKKPRKKGDVVEVEDHEGKYLISLKKAESAEKKKPDEDKK